MFTSLRALRTRFCSPVTLALIAAVVLSISASSAVAAPFVLTDGNSTASGDSETAQFLVDWVVDDVDQLERQSFFYRVGSVDPESPVGLLPLEQQVVSNTDLDPGDDTLYVRYGTNLFEIEVLLSLDGGSAGSGASDLGEQISIHNRGETPLEFHFFQYTDFDINGTLGGDEGYFANANSVRQYEGSLRLTETVITPVPSHRELSFFNTIIAKLNDGVPSNLDDTPADNVVIGPGDLTWAYQWDVVIPVGGTFQISKDKNLKAIPEPSAAVLALIALGTLVFIGRRRSR